jgi:hypothetical protein
LVEKIARSARIRRGLFLPASIINMEPAPGYHGSTGSIGLYMHGHNAELDSVSLGWFRAPEVDFAGTEKPQVLVRVTEHKKVEAIARQATRRRRMALPPDVRLTGSGSKRERGKRKRDCNSRRRSVYEAEVHLDTWTNGH